MRKYLKLSIDILFYILLFIVLVYVANIFYFRVIKKENAPRIFNYYVFNVLTGSMENKLHINDYILVKKTKNIKENDIITFKVDDSYVTHRVVKIEKNQIITKGDANNTEDDPITKDDVVGKYVCKLGFIGFLIKYKYIIAALVIILYTASCFIKKEN